VEDIEAQRSLAGKAALRALGWAQRGVPWQYSTAERRLLDRAVRRRVDELEVDAVLGIGEVDTPTRLPTFLYQDTNAAVVLAYQEETGSDHSNLLAMRPELLRRRASEQIERARSASAVFTMSNWFGDFLVGRGVARERVVPVGAGMNSPPTTYRDPDREALGRVLFVGTDFWVKGGDLVVEAVGRLNEAGDRQVRLTIVGPESWPMKGEPPPFVDFRGRLASSQMSALYSTHDVLAMPSRLEGFGIALAEALVAGLPCVSRNAFGMPEIVEDGESGVLVESEDPVELAAALVAVMSDAGVFHRVAALRSELLRRYDWSTVAAAMVDRVASVVETRP
jgi:glycosyltransferase involved in cell wall biosynthesis